MDSLSLQLCLNHYAKIQSIEQGNICDCSDCNWQTDKADFMQINTHRALMNEEFQEAIKYALSL